MNTHLNANYIIQWICYILSSALYLIALLLHFEVSHILLLLFGLHILLSNYLSIACETSLQVMLCRAGLINLCVIFCCLCPQWFFFLIFPTTYRNSEKSKNRYIQILYHLSPTLIYYIFQLFKGPGEKFTILILQGLLLLGLSMVFYLGTQIILRYYESGFKMQELLSRSAIIELQERNLNRELAIKNYLADRNARLEEREHISRSIHNVVGHTITAAVMALEASELLYDVSAEKAKDKMFVAKLKMQQSLEAIRKAVRVLDDEQNVISVNDFSESILSAINQFIIASNVKIRHNLTNPLAAVMIPSAHARFLQEALLEALSNGIRHGRATAFIVLLLCDPKHLQITVEDNGKGAFHSFEELKCKLEQGYGLKKIEQYLRNYGGELKLSHEDGWKIAMILPLVEEAMHE